MIFRQYSLTESDLILEPGVRESMPIPGHSNVYGRCLVEWKITRNYRYLSFGSTTEWISPTGDQRTAERFNQIFLDFYSYTTVVNSSSLHRATTATILYSNGCFRLPVVQRREREIDWNVARLCVRGGGGGGRLKINLLKQLCVNSSFPVDNNVRSRVLVNWRVA